MRSDQYPPAPGEGPVIELGMPRVAPTAKTWDDFPTTYLPGDLVKTAFGRGVVTEAKQRQGVDQYTIWHLPATERPRKPWGRDSIKEAWFGLDELELVMNGPASSLRYAEMIKQ